MEHFHMREGCVFMDGNYAGGPGTSFFDIPLDRYDSARWGFAREEPRLFRDKYGVLKMREGAKGKPSTARRKMKAAYRRRVPGMEHLSFKAWLRVREARAAA